MKKYEKIAQDRDRLHRLYRDEKWTLSEIADEYEVSHYTIKNAFEEAGLKIRSRGGGSRTPPLHERLAEEHEDELRKLYNIELLQISEIAVEYDVSTATIHRAFDNAGIDKKNLTERVRDCHDIEGMYINECLSMYDIADNLGVCPEVVRKAIHDIDIPTRPVGWQMESPDINTPLKESHLAYLAGLIDGEGHVSAAKNTEYRHDKELRFWVKMGSKECIKTIQKRVGGNISHEKRDGERDMWKWNASKMRNIWILCHAIRPYVKNKGKWVDQIIDHVSENYSEFLPTTNPNRSEFVTGQLEDGYHDLYFAGLLDGEGNIGVYETGSGHYAPRIWLQMGAKETVKWVYETYNGNFNHNPRTKTGHSDMWVYACQRQDDVKEILERVAPHMMVRDEQAKQTVSYIKGESEPLDSYKA